MRKIKLQKIVGNLLDKLRKLYMIGIVIQKLLAFLKVQKILGNFCSFEQKKVVGCPLVCSYYRGTRLILLSLSVILNCIIAFIIVIQCSSLGKKAFFTANLYGKSQLVMQERRLQIKTPHKSLFLTGLSGTEGRDFVARLISRLCRSKKSTCGQVYLS